MRAAGARALERARGKRELGRHGAQPRAPNPLRCINNATQQPAIRFAERPARHAPKYLRQIPHS
ncbi:hypothetical protein BCR61_07590 [Xanthomonas oryzae pv. oryzae]|nr:hypothetical protein BCR61_07590 [Xanthomonas oryzae pv. oryzae]AZK85906.1 hypothetical protein BO993_00650 [Xanthomonas oryzae pv. oryzae]OLH05079.1 hypothetical protein BXO589_08485 [Xanthomonas oryzae pv. oryzae]OLH22016.1 hypothetical protein BXO590_12670 [Xanthomonas oryzae pv. oryzae]OLH37224.1 hypothetical protein DXO116_03990 [Xanthomonas oryzae pv. oryzae]